jgi:hypothetical protein
MCWVLFKTLVNRMHAMNFQSIELQLVRHCWEVLESSHLSLGSNLSWGTTNQAPPLSLGKDAGWSRNRAHRSYWSRWISALHCWMILRSSQWVLQPRADSHVFTAKCSAQEAWKELEWTTKGPLPLKNKLCYVCLEERNLLTSSRLYFGEREESRV